MRSSQCSRSLTAGITLALAAGLLAAPSAFASDPGSGSTPSTNSSVPAVAPTQVPTPVPASTPIPTLTPTPTPTPTPTTSSTTSTATPAPSSTPTPAPTPIPTGTAIPEVTLLPADDGAAVINTAWLDKRMIDLQIKSPAVGATVLARVLFPPGWSPQADRTWPVLYLLQGAHDDYTAWSTKTSIEAFTADKDVIVVMPSAGPTGLPTDWWNNGKNAPDYETFEVTELMQLLQRDYRAGSVRAVAGVSTGGYGAIMMAAHHPGAFAAAASYSGILDTTYPGMPVVLGAIVARESLRPDSLWGDPVGNEPMWAMDDPYEQATQLRSTALFISCGDGRDSGADKLGGTLESALWQQTLAFTARLKLLGIPVQTDLYAGGVHDWSSWEGEFNRSWPLLSASLGLSL